MRFTGLLVALLFIAGAARAEMTPAMCEYAHPEHPGWDYFRSCNVTTTEAAGATTTRAEVSNGSNFTVEAVNHADGEQISVNGRPADRLLREGADCFLTRAAKETICIHPAGAEAPLAPAAPPAVDDTPLAMTPGIGGGEEGFCLLTETSDGQVRLADHGACARAENCQVEEDTGQQSCLTLYVWKNGRENGLYRTSGWLALDGTEVSETAPDCWGGDGGPTLCFARQDWAADQLPARVEPKPEPDTATETALANAAPGATAPVAGQPAGDGATVAGLCRFLKDGIAVATGACRQTRTCADDSCDVGYSLDSGLSVHLNVVSGQVQAIDGHSTGPMPLPSSGTVCVPYLASPFIFCFAPT